MPEGDHEALKQARDKHHRGADRLTQQERKRIHIINASSVMREDHGLAILTANQRTLHDLALGCALVEQESSGANIFGCDNGPQGGKPPFCEDKVTRERVEALLKQGLNNGVGLTQLTDRSLIHQAEMRGGAHLPLNQCIVGFDYLKQLKAHYGPHGLWHYNGSPSYQDELMEKYRAWQHRLG